MGSGSVGCWFLFVLLLLLLLLFFSFGLAAGLALVLRSSSSLRSNLIGETGGVLSAGSMAPALRLRARGCGDEVMGREGVLGAAATVSFFTTQLRLVEYKNSFSIL
jgi:hypothetical protein